MLWALTLTEHSFGFFLFCFYFVLNSCFVPHLCCWIWQSSNVSWAWLSDSFGRLSPNLWCLFKVLSIEMCSIAVYLQPKHDLTCKSLHKCKQRKQMHARHSLIYTKRQSFLTLQKRKISSPHSNLLYSIVSVGKCVRHQCFGSIATFSVCFAHKNDFANAKIPGRC